MAAKWRRGALFCLLVAAAREARAQAVIEDDVKYLACPVCEKVAEMLSATVGDARAAGMDVQEEAVAALVSNMCEVEGDVGGVWLRSSDYRLSDDSKSFIVDVHDRPGRCGSECLTMSKACSGLLRDGGEDIVDALLHAEGSPDEFVREVCQEITGACTKRRAITDPAGRGEEAFEPMSDEELRAEYEAMAGDDSYEDGYDEGEWGGGMPPMPIVDSPLARLENWLWDKYVQAASWVGLRSAESQGGSAGAGKAGKRDRGKVKTEV